MNSVEMIGGGKKAGLPVMKKSQRLRFNFKENFKRKRVKKISFEILREIFKGKKKR